MSARILRPLDSQAVGPRPFLTYDFEWFPETPETVANRTAYKIRIASAYDPQKDKAFSFAHSDFDDPRPIKSADPVDAFIKALLVPRYSGFRFYAHWGGISDTLYLFRKIYDLNLPTKIVVNGSAAAIITVNRCSRDCRVPKCKHRKYDWTFVDSSFTFRFGLARLAELMGLRKGGDAGTSWNTQNDRELTDYNYLDNFILSEAITKVQSTVNDMGANLGLTMSATSIDLFRRRYLKDSIATPKEANDFAKLSYYASRVEPYKFQMKSGHSYDVNSSFVFSMTHTLPGSPLFESHGKLPDDMQGMWIADCDVEVPEMYLPPLPYRSPRDGRIFFPTGKWSSVFTSVDLELALSVGCKVGAVRRVIHYESREDLKSFAEDVYAKRMASADKFSYTVYKLTGNGAYGKFGESEEKVEYLMRPLSTFCDIHYKIVRGAPFCRAHGAIGCKVCHAACGCMTLVSPGVWRFNSLREIQHRHTQIVAFITSIARRTLYQGQYTYQDYLHYSDTDCLHLSGKIGELPRYGSLSHMPVDGKLLGGFKHEGERRNMSYAAPKIYGGEDGNGDPILHAKGFRVGGKTFDIEKGREVYGPKAVERFRAIIAGKPVFDSRMVRPKEYLSKSRFLNIARPYEVSIGENGKRLQLSNRPKRKQTGPNETRPWSITELLDDDSR